MEQSSCIQLAAHSSMRGIPNPARHYKMDLRIIASNILGTSCAEVHIHANRDMHYSSPIQDHVQTVKIQSIDELHCAPAHEPMYRVHA